MIEDLLRQRTAEEKEEVEKLEKLIYVFCEKYRPLGAACPKDLPEEVQ